MIPDKAVEKAAEQWWRITITPFRTWDTATEAERTHVLGVAQQMLEAAVPYLTADATPDDEAAWEAWRDEAEDDDHTVELTREAFLAGRVSGRADAANTPLPADHEAIVHARKQGHENGWNAAGAALRDMADELARSRAECQHLNDRLDEAGEHIADAAAQALEDAADAIERRGWDYDDLRARAAQYREKGKAE